MRNDLTLDDFRQHLDQLSRLGIGDVMRLANRAPESERVTAEDVTEVLPRLGRIIDVMTPEERANPDGLDQAAKDRIAAAARVEGNEVDELIRHFGTVRDVMRQLLGMDKDDLLKLATGLMQPPEGA